jgi:hypothetical protein
MKSFLILLISLFVFSPLTAETVIITPGYPLYYDLYQPYSGPMRGPNSLEGKKQMQRELQPEFYRYPYSPNPYFYPYR